ncbi:MAG: gliding motility-associated C-terminal domain-containing protein [Bacteroidales bacterium]
MKALKLISSIFLVMGFSSFLSAQCHIDILKPTKDTTICQGDSVHLVSDGACTFFMNNDFDDGSIGVGWSSTGANPVFTNPCGTGPDSVYLWVGTTPSNTRSLETHDYDVSSTNCIIKWYMRYGAQPGSGDCEDPDLSDEGVNLQYSTNGGASWTNFPGLNQYPQGTNNYTNNTGAQGDDFMGITTTPGTGGEWEPDGVTSSSYPPQGSPDDAVYYWHEYENTIPAAAATQNTRFRFIQLSNSSAGFDAWGVDEVEIYCPGHQNIAWSHGVQAFDGGWVKPQSTTTYNVFILDTSGHSASASVTITVTPEPDPGLGPDTTICDFGNNYALLEADTGFDSYSWSTGATTRVDTVSSSGTYYVTVMDGNCSGSDSINVTVQPAPTANAGPDEEICIGDTVTLTAASINGFYAWSTGDSTQSTTVSPEQDTTYHLTVGSSPQCMSYDSVKVTVNPLPDADAGADEEICDGDQIDLTASGGQQYEWSTGDMISTITVSPTSTSEYMVTVTDTNGCVNADTVEVVVHPLPNVIATAKDSVICLGDETEVMADGDATTYEWNFGKTGTPQTVSPMKDQTYTVTGTDDNGCQNTDEVTIVAEDCSTFFIPNAFSPDGDGVNDVFKPVGEFSAIEEYEFTVYDRWGNIIFNTEDPNEGWDGTIEEEPAPTGVYIYDIYYKSVWDKEFTKSGSVTLLR